LHYVSRLTQTETSLIAVFGVFAIGRLQYLVTLKFTLDE